MDTTKLFDKFSYLTAINAEYIDEIYARYLEDPNSIDDTWRYLFEGIELGAEFSENSVASPAHQTQTPPSPATAASGDRFSLEMYQLTHSFREQGHKLAHLDPLEMKGNGVDDSQPEVWRAKLLEMGVDPNLASQVASQPSLKGLSDKLKQVYCQTVGVEAAYITQNEVRNWLYSKVESGVLKQPLSKELKLHVLKKLTQAEGLENFLHTRYIGAKRFSLEGGDAIIPALDVVLDEACQRGSREVVMGMAHRGRLNVLTNLLGKKYEILFSEFEGNYNESAGEGDVKYHMGYSTDVKTISGGQLHFALLANPSHLEIVDPVVEGVVRAKQERMKDADRTQVLPVLIHGDAAFAGQGLVYETLQLSKLKGYKTGGTLHFIINNQIGFTTDPIDSRSTLYCSDLAKMFEMPVFHVNGDDAEALVNVTKLAVEFIRKFQQDVVIDIVCYRKYGHNEGDEPSYTQPLMYKKIKVHKTPRTLYGERLVREGIITDHEVTTLNEQVLQTMLDAQHITKKDAPKPSIAAFDGVWKKFRLGLPQDFGVPVPATKVSAEVLREVGKCISTAPGGFNVHSKLLRLLEQRRKMIDEGQGIDWGMGEALAFGSLLLEGVPVRLSGQDVERGTFSHRQSVLYDFENGSKQILLNNIRPDSQAKYMVHNSHLSEQAVLGFEFGYSVAEPNALVIWEAQFGDFANGGQIVIDQFICSAESKWQRSSGLVMLLPHGFEGQGPEHSSARLERFLGLCGRYNMTVCNLTTPAQIFHALRRQVKREFRKPLVVMSPKSLLRSPFAVSTFKDFTDDVFHEVLEDRDVNKSEVKRVLFCTGKIYYELFAERQKLSRTDTALVRVEELYPWPEAQVKKVLSGYPNVKDVYWVQEEPKNMGAWRSIYEPLVQSLQTGQSLHYIGREVAAAPAVGSPKRHEREQRAIIDQSFT